MDKMKILMVSDTYPPITGGLGRHVQLLSRELIKKGHEVVVFTVCYPDLPEYEEKAGVKSYRSQGFFQRSPFLYKDVNNKKPAPICDWLISKKLKQVIKDEKPDIVHAHGWIIYSVLPLKKELEIPLAATLHDYGLICPKTTLLRENTICNEPFTSKCLNCGKSQYGVVKSLATYLGIKMNKVKLNKVDKFIAGSTFAKNVYSQYSELNNKDIAIIPNFYTIEPGYENQVNERLPKDFILFVGALMPDKGVDILIKAYLKQKTETKLVLIGARHPEYDYKKTENIWIIENASRELLMDAYQRCQFAVFPSMLFETCSMVALEAMSHKKAIIVSDRGGFPDIVEDQVTGILVLPHNLTALSDALTYLFANPNTANAMGYKGYDRWWHNFSPEVIVPKIESLYKSLMHDNHTTTVI